MYECTEVNNKVYTRLILETCYDNGEIITTAITTNRVDLSVDELAEHIRGVFIAAGYAPQSVESIIPFG